MILGRGKAKTEAEILVEYHQYLEDYHPASSPTIRQRLWDVPEAMVRQIGRPFLQWSDEEVITLYARRGKYTHYGYNVFLAFLFFRGYRRATLNLLTTLQLSLVRHFRPALEPILERLRDAERALQYRPARQGHLLQLLIALLATVNRPLEELTRAEFDAFAEEYQAWYRYGRPQANGRSDARLTRLEYYFIHWEILSPAVRIPRHETHFAQLRHEPIRAAILLYLDWCQAKYKPSTIYTHRAALTNFFLWLQQGHPQSARLDSVTRKIALQYGKYLQQEVVAGRYSLHYATDLQRCVRLFHDFVIDERLATSPDRNPFALRDLPRQNDPVPRYLADHEVRRILSYCDDGASLKERTIVVTLLHTGIRAAELAALKVSNIVEIQGTWKLHIQEGKGLKDRLIPLTPQCLQVLQQWQRQGWEACNDYLFTRHGRPWKNGANVCAIIRQLGQKLGVEGLTPHRFRHTFAVALLNYGMRESALQKVMGHTTLTMTLEYARILDKTVEQAFNAAVAKMQSGPISWLPDFLQTDAYATLVSGTAVNWIRLPHGYCRRHLKLHCESDVKCLLCDRYYATVEDLPRLQEMHDRYLQLAMPVKATAVQAQIMNLQAGAVGNRRSGIFISEDELCLALS